MPDGKVDLSTTAALITFSDTHENHVYGLGPPTFTKSNGDVVKANPLRLELWGVWNRFWDEAFKLTQDVPRVANPLGDIIENDSKVRGQHELVSLSPADAKRMVTETLTPIYNECDAVLTVRGTPAHTGQDAWFEESIADDFDHSIRDEKHGSASWWHFYGQFGGVYFDLAHHASMGNIKRNMAGAAGRLAYDVREEYVMEWGLRPPDLVYRAHNHRWADSGFTYPTRAFMVGCFQFKSMFLHRINAGYKMPNLGGVVTICDRGKYELIPIQIKPRKMVAWKSK